MTHPHTEGYPLALQIKKIKKN